MNKIGERISVDGLGGYANVHRTSRDGGGYDVVITIPFATKELAQTICKEFVKHGLQTPPLSADES